MDELGLLNDKEVESLCKIVRISGLTVGGEYSAGTQWLVGGWRLTGVQRSAGYGISSCGGWDALVDGIRGLCGHLVGAELRWVVGRRS